MQEPYRHRKRRAIGLNCREHDDFLRCEELLNVRILQPLDHI